MTTRHVGAAELLTAVRVERAESRDFNPLAILVQGEPTDAVMVCMIAQTRIER